jgi:hypothetical protein
MIFPAKQFVTTGDKMKRAILAIREELGERIAEFERDGKLLEAQRIKQRTEFDLEMMEKWASAPASKIIRATSPTARPARARPRCFDFFPDDYLLVIDESHVTVPQIGGMYEGDRSRKTVLVNSRLPPAERAGQPAAELSGIPGDAKPDDLRQRHARAARNRLVAQGKGRGEGQRNSVRAPGVVDWSCARPA